MSPPVGPAGILECNGDEPAPRTAPAPRLFRVGAAYSVFATDLTFLGSQDAYIERRAATVSLSYRYSDKITLQGSLGATLGGRFVFGEERYTFDPGWLASFAATWKILGKKRDDWFLMLGAALGATGSVTRDSSHNAESMYALDARLSLMGGRTFFDVLTPYAVARAFGGPIFWKYRTQDVIGGDKYHVQLGLGLVVALPEHFDVFAEAIPLGERAAVAGLGYSF